jgi:hypothetical protein
MCEAQGLSDRELLVSAAELVMKVLTPVVQQSPRPFPLHRSDGLGSEARRH